jgi:ribokinase
MGAPILVAGLVNLETTLRVDRFPIVYSPNEFVFDGVGSDVGGVGYNVARALHTLGHDVRFVAMAGRDEPGSLIRNRLRSEGLGDEHVVEIPATPQSVILYESGGRRQSNTDLKDLQRRSYPAAAFAAALEGAALAVMCNVNFAREHLETVIAAGVPIATDVHTIPALDHPYEIDFLEAGDILFMSDERLPQSAEVWLPEFMDRYTPQVAVVGMGNRGALLAERDRKGTTLVSPVRTREPVGTIGAGDALFAAFVHGMLEGRAAHQALKRAAVFASYKIGSRGASQGFLTAAQLDDWVNRVDGNANRRRS